MLPLYDKLTEDPNWNNLYPNRGNVNAWIASTDRNFSGSTLASGVGAECIRWAANSDKWLLQEVMYRGKNRACGSNCVAANWVDQQAFFTSHNANVPIVAGTNPAVTGNNTGDMWVDGGTANLGNYEDTTGTWHAVPGYIPTSVENTTFSSVNSGMGMTIRVSGAQMHLELPGVTSFVVQVYNARGNLVMQQNASAKVVLSTAGFASGVYQVVAANGREKLRGCVYLVQ